MQSEFERLEPETPISNEARGGFLGMALLAMTLGAGAALLFAPAEGAKTRKLVGGRLRELRGGAEETLARIQHEFGRRDARRRRERGASALLGLAVGAGLAALLVPESGPQTRRRIADRIKRDRREIRDQVERMVQEPQLQPEPTP
jgi:gas vesicle protein